MKLISIDPSYNGTTGLIVAEYADFDALNPDEELLTITNFANIDFRGEGSKEQIDEYRYRKMEELLRFIETEEPDFVILENFIMFKVQMGQFGQSFGTSEMIGMITLHCRRLEIPVIKPRSSDVRAPIHKMYTYTCGKTGEEKTVPAPRKFKPGLTNKDLQERGILVRGRYNKAYLNANGELYDLAEFKTGENHKNDHIWMSIRHMINIVELASVSWETKVNKQKEAWNEENA